jgi:UDP-glucose 4-epimerase
MTEGKDRSKRAALGELAVKGILRLPGMDRWHPWLRQDKSDMRWIPINADIQMPEDAPVPLEILYRFIEEASHRVIVDYCGCRKGWKCKDYPVEIGCLMMGDSALEITRFPFREVGPDEAREHALKAVEAGLVPIVGKARVDNYIFGVKDHSRMLTVCFCCDCCCITRFTRYLPLRSLDPIWPRLDGISMTVTEKCKGCGKCVERCYIKAIRVQDGKAVIADTCRACGRCAAGCPSKAIEVKIDDPDFVEKAYSRIRSYVKCD